MRSSPAYRSLLAAVQKISDVRIFLGLRHAQLRAAGVGNDLAETAPQRHGRKDGRQERVQILAVFGHAGRDGKAHDALARKPGKTRIEQRGEKLAHAVGAEIEAQHAIAVLHSVIAADHRRQHELVGHIVGIGIGDDRGGVEEARPVSVHHHIVSASRRDPSACRGPWRSSGRLRWRWARMAAGRPGTAPGNRRLNGAAYRGRR